MPRSIFPQSLGSRLTLTFVGVIGVAMLVLVAIVPPLARSHQLATLENRLAAEAQFVADYVVTELERGDPADLDALAKRLGQRTQTRITIIALGGTVLGESHQNLAQVGNHAGRQEVRQALAEGRGVDLHSSETVGYAMLYVAVPIVRDGVAIGTARVALPLSEVDRVVADLTGTILLAAAGSGLLAIVVALFASWEITRPLARLTRQAAMLADDPSHGGHLHRGHGPAEVVQLGKTLDRLVTAVRESLRRVEAERDRLDVVLANLADGVVLVDGNGRVTRLNTAAERLLGAQGVVTTGRTVVQVLRDHDLVSLVERVRTEDAATQRHGDAETSAKWTDESTATAFLEWRNPRRFLRAVVSRFGPGQNGESSQTLLVLQDLTELRRLETIRRDFVANVSHELRTPLASIKAMVETLEDGALDDPPAARDFVGRIHGETDRLQQIVEELLHLSRIESGQFQPRRQPVAPADLLRRVVERLEPMATRAQLTLSAVPAGGLPTVAADPEQIEQVLVNLVHNAIKFTLSGGSVTLGAAAHPQGVVLSVADTGVGIAPELLARVFERFYKADQARSGGGTGLGLAIAKHIVQAHGGHIWAESQPGKGATFYFTLKP
ncbi:MAG: PAS domain-containing protein [Chloroflexi bacterium]|nr:PAS domain-containing protein [Chloroflexota bacterium]